MIDHNSSQNWDRARKAALERDNLLKQIRSLPEFEHFLLPLPFSKLRLAAAQGPVVMINSTKRYCDALIMTSSDASVIHLWLSKVDANALHVQHQRLRKALEELGIHTRDIHDVDRAGRVARQRAPGQTMLDEVLEWLWTMVVSPVHDVLKNVGQVF